jgi:hypothetical protein
MNPSLGDIVKIESIEKVGVILNRTILSYKKDKMIYECLVGNQIYFCWKNQLKKAYSKKRKLR